MTNAPGFTRDELHADRSTALARVDRDYSGIELAMPAAEAKRRLQQLQAFVQEVMIKDEDFGIIPGTEKPSLFKPGAEKLAELYGFSHRYTETKSVLDWSGGFFYFEYRCELTSRRDGSFVGEGLGSCNSRESKYAGRWVGAEELPASADKAKYQRREGARWVFDNQLPKGTDRSKLRTRQGTSKKNGRAFTMYQVVDEQFLVPNPDPYSLVNTIQKMGAKRAYVGAVIAATRSSSLFTQDTEDLPPEAFGEPERRRTPAHDEETGEVHADVHMPPNGPQRDVEATHLREIESATSPAKLNEIRLSVASDVEAGYLTAAQSETLSRASVARYEALRAAHERSKRPSSVAPERDPGQD